MQVLISFYIYRVAYISSSTPAILMQRGRVHSLNGTVWMLEIWKLQIAWNCFAIATCNARQMLIKLIIAIAICQWKPACYWYKFKRLAMFQKRLWALLIPETIMMDYKSSGSVWCSIMLLGEGAPSRTTAWHLTSLDLASILRLLIDTLAVEGFFPISPFRYLR